MDEIRIRLDRERVLRFDGSALITLERTTGTSIIRILSRFADRDVPFNFIVAMLYAGLQHELPGLSEDQVLKLIDRTICGGTLFEKVMGFALQCAEALATALPKADEGKNVVAPEPTPGSAGTGRAMSESDTVSVSTRAPSGA